MLEMELKFRVDELSVYEEKLRGLGAEPEGPVEENNLILDMMGAPLGKMDLLFRLRNMGDRTLVTVKKPLPATALKVRKELEAVMECPQEKALELFSLLGYGTVYSYRKTRNRCRLGNATVCLDSLWFGDFVEIEATSEDSVMEAAELLGLDPEEGIRFSYAALQRDAETSRRALEKS